MKSIGLCAGKFDDDDDDDKGNEVSIALLADSVSSFNPNCKKHKLHGHKIYFVFSTECMNLLMSEV